MSAPAETTWKRTRGKLARLSQDLPPDAPELRALRGELKTQRTAEYIEKVLSSAPPLNDEQRTRLAELLRPVRQPAPDDRQAVVEARLAQLDGGGDHAA